ncbi:MAG: ABC transporter ATP-binding protein, partial [Candidatus Cloacimonetes bacterium]|nr:ABC transporter ATP-binding protein [Candidatus Cloacimonadota bacterium]
MIEIQDICVSYGEKKVLNGISLSFTKGEFTFILGPNGAGKSTLLKSLNRIVGIDTGSIKVKNTLISDYEEKELAKQLAFIPQEFAMQFDYTVYDFLLMGRYPWLDFWGNYKASDHAMVEKYIVRLGLQEFRERFFNQLSGGEKQRVLIARALVQETDIILLDESISFLDINHQIEILRLLQEIRVTENKTIIMVSHNLNLAAEF